MAGFYPDVPNHRMAWDHDGSVLLTLDGNRSNPSVQTLGMRQAVNSENIGQNLLFPADGYYGVIFPELRDITGYITYATGQIWTGGPVSAWTSSDTTNGADGNWTNRGAWATNGTSFAAFRNSITTVSWTGVKSVLFKSGGNAGWGPYAYNIHLYGVTASGQNPDRLRLWHPTLDQEVGPAHFDWGDVYRGQTVVKQFRVKNNSSTLTANTITISRDALTDGGTQTTVVGHQLSDDGVSYGNTASISSLAAGAISSIKYVRYAPTTSASLGLRWARVIASAASWS